MLTVQIYADSSQTKLLADPSSRAEGLRFTTNERGFAVLTITRVIMSLADSFEVYEWPGTPHVVVTDSSGMTIWEGRVEDISIVRGGVALAAFGYSRALEDVPYTALWSYTRTAGWTEVTEQERATAVPSAYEMDNNNRIYIAPKKGETYPGGATNIGAMSYAAPHNGSRTITNFSASYNLLLPSGWTLRLYSATRDFSTVSTEATVNATGSAQSGTWNVTLANPRPRVYVAITNAGGSGSSISDETGVNFARLTDIRMASTTAATVTASAIATALVTYVNGVNGGQLSASTSLIEATTTDLRDEVYEDEYPGDLLYRLALLHGYEWGVWEGRRLHFRPLASAGRHWYVDVVGGLEMQRSLENIRNSAYAVYRNAAGRIVRTLAAGDKASQTRYGLVRRGYLTAQTTSATEAAAHRDAWLADRSMMQDRARIDFVRVFDETGAPYPLYYVRAGDRVTMRNLPPTLSGNVDRIRTFLVGETVYDADRDEISVSPSVPTPTLATLLARREAGI